MPFLTTQLVAQFGAAKSGMVMVTLPVDEEDPAVLRFVGVKYSRHPPPPCSALIGVLLVLFIGFLSALIVPSVCCWVEQQGSEGDQRSLPAHVAPVRGANPAAAAAVASF